MPKQTPTFTLNQTFANYKDLCNFLSVPVQSGKAKINHLNFLKTFVKFSQKGHTLKVEEILNPNPPIIYGASISRPGLWEEHFSALILSKLQASFGEASHQIKTLCLPVQQSLELFNFPLTWMEELSKILDSDIHALLYDSQKHPESQLWDLMEWRQGELDSTEDLLQTLAKAPKRRQNFTFPFQPSPSYGRLTAKFPSLALWRESHQILGRAFVNLNERSLGHYQLTPVFQKEGLFVPASDEERSRVFSLEVKLLQTFKAFSEDFILAKEEALRKENLHSWQLAHCLWFAQPQVEFSAKYMEELGGKLGAKYRIGQGDFKFLVKHYRGLDSIPKAAKFGIEMLDMGIEL